ncbi:hypothetical protein ETAA1_34780 [Urbifossiella limnaea]|uniref:Uncharacterized protein n=1 Tax=Urbifossiella limnaea TaxID=2528023 RepID=A0A517XVH1_9BACT|nr:hypothetical protein ETAA1_34780 [Urbifossiella limnaea]
MKKIVMALVLAVTVVGVVGCGGASPTTKTSAK